MSSRPPVTGMPAAPTYSHSCWLLSFARQLRAAAVRTTRRAERHTRSAARRWRHVHTKLSRVRGSPAATSGRISMYAALHSALLHSSTSLALSSTSTSSPLLLSSSLSPLHMVPPRSDAELHSTLDCLPHPECLCRTVWAAQSVGSVTSWSSRERITRLVTFVASGWQSRPVCMARTKRTNSSQLCWSSSSGLSRRKVNDEMRRGRRSPSLSMVERDALCRIWSNAPRS
mmetsp:Transcript_8758/g.35772  ORF Transcript_8758/g.35772 Transcript_8758/m.35772 type:complete len:229 (+) Transcript_8758:410-1096(+)